MTTSTFTPVDVIDDWCAGWLAPTPGFMQRASHVLRDDDGNAWIIDPVDGPHLDAFLDGKTVAGVVQLMDRHGRDCARVASRLGVPVHYLPRPGADLPFDVIDVVVQPRIRWVEIALWLPSRKALVVADALGTTDYHCAPGEPVGVHPLMRLSRPPRMLAGRPVQHLLCGHGHGLHGPDTGAQIDTAIVNARRGIPALARRIASDARRRLLG